MKIQLASSYGFCFGVKRAIEIAEEHRGSKTYGPLIHNKDEINRLKVGFNIGLAEKLEDVNSDDSVVIRTMVFLKMNWLNLKHKIMKL